jgi:membrane carboxypeptidase/penicillin-binding protein PbpC
MRLGDGIQDRPGQIEGEPLLDPVATWQITDVLSGVLPPAGAVQRGIAYKTGTSYGYRDAWSVGFDGRHVLGVWVGRPDNGAVPGLTGYGSAAPILFEGFAKSGVATTPLPRAPAGATRRSFIRRREPASNSGSIQRAPPCHWSSSCKAAGHRSAGWQTASRCRKHPGVASINGSPMEPVTRR